MKILLLDIETSPNLAHIWGLRDQYINPQHLLESSYVLCWAAKWLNDKEVFFDSVKQSSAKTMLRKIHKLIDSADAVVHYNGSKFDIPTLNKEFLLHSLPPPAPYKQIDLLKSVRQQFRFPSNKLDYVAQRLGLGKKTEHEGYTLWVKCMNKDKDAWVKMEEYNKQDVLLLEKVYAKVLPWIKNHPNRGLFDGNGCPTCGSERLQKRGYAHTSTGTYQRFQCVECGSWSRSTKAVKESVKIVNAAC